MKSDNPKEITNPSGGAAGDKDARVVLICGFVLGFALLMAWAFIPTDELLIRIPDDSFYYFQPASWMARGYIPSFDGIHPGNGFNPLWMLLLTPIFLLKDVDLELPIHLAVAFAGIIFLLSGYVLYRILREFDVGKLWAAYAAATFALWPAAIATAVDGEVTPITILVAGVLLFAYIRVLKKGHPRKRDFALLGLLAGLAVLARFDNIILLSFLLLHYLTRRRPEKKLVSLAVMAAVFTALIIPWLAWFQAFSGSIIPTSGTAVPLMTRTSVNPDLPGPFGGLRAGLWAIWKGLPTFIFYFPLRWFVFVLYAVVIFLAIRAGKERRLSLELLLILLGFIVTLFLANAGIRRYLRLWHVGAAFMVNQLFIWYGLYMLFRKRPWARWAAHGIAALFLAFVVYNGARLWNRPFYFWQLEMKRGGEWARAHPEEKIGAFNCGILAYYGGGNVIVLDGNMNNSSFEAVKQRRIYDYCKREGITAIVDYDISTRRYYKPFWPESKLDRLVPISAELDDNKYMRIRNPYYIYRLK